MNNWAQIFTVDFHLGHLHFLQEGDGRTVSICESVATTVTATSDVENNFSDDEDNRMSDDSGTASAPSPSPLPTDDKGMGDISQLFECLFTRIGMVLPWFF